MDPELNHRFRSCCCHVKQCMKVAAGIMIAGSILSFVSALKSNYFYLFDAILWLISGSFALFGIRKIRPSFLVVTIAIVSFSSAGTIVGISVLIAQWNRDSEVLNDQIIDQESLTEKRLSAEAMLFGIIVAALVSVACDIWFLIVSVKCFQYLTAKKGFIASNYAL